MRDHSFCFRVIVRCGSSLLRCSPISIALLWLSSPVILFMVDLILSLIHWSTFYLIKVFVVVVVERERRD